MQIKGTIASLKYQVCLSKKLKEFNIENFNINQTPPCFLLKDNERCFAVSKWVSPKRSRSYPFERVYNTLHIPKRITIIPVVKDEGIGGDRDFIQWDTVSLMSLIDVYVILAYYDKAQINPRSKRRITRQRFNNDYILSKINEIIQYQNSASHWNSNELNKTLCKVIDQVKISYSKIEKLLNVSFHSSRGLDRFKNEINKDISSFIEFSRKKSQKSQSNEYKTIQPKKNTISSKAKITIYDYMGGQYFLTVDQILLTPKKIFLIEVMHNKNFILSSKSSIKDRLLKMILYSNLTKVVLDYKSVESECTLKLSSSGLKDNVTCKSTSEEIQEFFGKNNFSVHQKKFIQELFQEAKVNEFNLEITHLE